MVVCIRTTTLYLFPPYILTGFYKRERVERVFGVVLAVQGNRAAALAARRPPDAAAAAGQDGKDLGEYYYIHLQN